MQQGAVSEPVVVHRWPQARSCRRAGADFGCGHQRYRRSRWWHCRKTCGHGLVLLDRTPGQPDSEALLFWVTAAEVREQAITICLKQLLHQVTGYYTV